MPPYSAAHTRLRAGMPTLKRRGGETPSPSPDGGPTTAGMQRDPVIAMPSEPQQKADAAEDTAPSSLSHRLPVLRAAARNANHRKPPATTSQRRRRTRTENACRPRFDASMDAGPRVTGGPLRSGRLLPGEHVDPDRNGAVRPEPHPLQRDALLSPLLIEQILTV